MGGGVGAGWGGPSFAKAAEGKGKAEALAYWVVLRVEELESGRVEVEKAATSAGERGWASTGVSVGLGETGGEINEGWGVGMGGRGEVVIGFQKNSVGA